MTRATTKRPRERAPLDRALEHAAHGIPVFPLHGVRKNGACACGESACASPGKHPRTRDGFKSATTDEKQIRDWFQKDSTANIGGAMGGQFVALDIDPQRGGDEALRVFEAEHGSLPRGAVVKTGRHGGRRGEHLYYRTNGRRISSCRTKLAGVEIKGSGGYVVLPGSMHASGELYEWEATPLFEDAPPQLVALTNDAVLADHDERGKRDLTGLPIGKRSIRALNRGLPAPEDGETHREVAVGITRNFYEAGLPKPVVSALMARILEHPDSALDPHRPWTPDDLETIVASVVRDAAPDAKAQRARHERDDEIRPLYTLADAAREASRPIDWVIPDLLSAGEKAVIAGPPKSSKTWFALHLARAIALGNRALDQIEWDVGTPQPVLFLQEEGTHQRWAQRLVTVFADSADAPLSYAHRVGFSLLRETHVAWLIDQAQTMNARAVFLDPLQRVTPGVNENDASEVGPAWDAVHRIATETGAAVTILHHSRKGGGEPTMDSIRGSSRVAGEVDLIFVLRRTERGTLSLYLDGRDLPPRAHSEPGNLEIKYDVDAPHQMRVGGVRLNVKGPVNQTRPAIEDLLRNANGPLTSAEIRREVQQRLGEQRDRSRVNRTLNELLAEGLVTKTEPERGKANSWEWADA